MRDSAPEQRMKLVKSTGRQASSSAPAGTDRSQLEILLTPREISLNVESGNSLAILAIVAILTFAGMVMAFILA
jgi:hypothetical protein